MALTAQEIWKIRNIIALAEKLLAKDARRASGRANGKDTTKRIRRTGKGLAKFRKMLKTERRKGTPVAVLARKHGVSTAYIYMLP